MSRLRPCIGCKDWSGCKGFSHYTPGDIRYCWWQIAFLLPYMELLGTFRWPTEETNYTDSGINIRYIGSPHANFEEVCIIYFTLQRRIEATGKDGEDLMHELAVFNAPISSLTPRARDALNYCCGKERRLSYLAWKKLRNYRGSVHTKKYASTTTRCA